MDLPPSPHTIEASALREEGSALLNRLGVASFFADRADLYSTGSFALNLMTWRDIDLQIRVRPGVAPMDLLAELFLKLSREPGFIEAQLTVFEGDYKPKMPRGIYLGLQLIDQITQKRWKLDVWSLADADFERNRALIAALQANLTEERRERILAFKQALMGPNGRVPQMGSYYLCQAVLLEGLSSQEEVWDYLRQKGVAL